jgi:hypothetical protein
MGFASAYLDERAIFPELIKEAPGKDTAIIIVVPAYDEPGIGMMLDSLASCSVPNCGTEVIIVVNAPADASAESVRNNKITLENIEKWKEKNSDVFFRIHPIEAFPGNLKDWGVGLARKTGMDEAVRRFNKLNRPEGVILNLDADCRVEKNYFVSVYNELLNNKERSACSLYFEHPLDGENYHAEVYRSIALYELHLRYYFQGLIYSGYPYVYHTVGSAIAVKALPYIKAGGMNRKRAGEDFYFIQKLIPAGGFFNLNSTTVYPSPRPSFRVPFGTGASISKMTGSGQPDLLTYNMLAFKELKLFFSLAEDHYIKRHQDFAGFYKSLPSGVKSFIGEMELYDKLAEIKNNTSGFPAYKKRFFGWFNMFRVVKYLNHVHSGIYVKKPVCEASSELLMEKKIIEIPEDPGRLLSIYRSLEKDN